MKSLFFALLGAMFGSLIAAIVSWYFILTQEQGYYLWAAFVIIGVVAALIIAEDVDA